MTRVNGRSPQNADGMRETQIQALPAPTTTLVQTGKVTDAEGHEHDFVLLQVASANGQFTFFFSPERAADLGDELVEGARLAKSGLLIAGPGDLPQ